MPRLSQFILIASTLALSWLGMQAVHELGHVLGAVATGGRVTRVVLHPATFSRTDVAPNPAPLLVVWAGPVVGVLLPLAAYALGAAVRLPGRYLLRFFAGFCLVANGAYIGVGSFARLADAGDMLRHGSPHWQLLLFGVLTVPVGLYLWNGLGPHFGLGPTARRVDRRAAGAMLAVLVVGLAIELALSPR